MPVTCCYFWAVLGKCTFLFRCCKIPHFCGFIIWTTYKFHRTHRKWKISHRKCVFMSTKVVFGIDHLIAINNISLFISCDKELLIVTPDHGLHSIFVHVTRVLIVQTLSIPHYYLPLWRARHDLLSILHPFHLVYWFFVFVAFALAKEVCASYV